MGISPVLTENDKSDEQERCSDQQEARRGCLGETLLRGPIGHFSLTHGERAFGMRGEGRERRGRFVKDTDHVFFS